MNKGNSLLNALTQYSPALRSWQAAALEKWEQHFRGTVSVVTGGGKTVFALLCMREALARFEDLQFLIVVPTIALLDQWHYSLTHDVGLPSEAVEVPTSRGKRNSSARVNIAVINTARKLVNQLTEEGRWFICVDECHRAGSPENALALQGKFVATLGLSATPERQYDHGFQEIVAPVLGDIIFTYSFSDALRDKVVSEFRLENYRIPLTQSEEGSYNRLSRFVAIEMQKIRGRGDGSSAVLDRLLRQRASVIVAAKWRIPAAAALASQFDKPTLIFHERIDAAAEIENLANKLGRRSVAYHSGLSSGMRYRNLSLFRERIADTLVTCRSLDEGFNVPEAEIGILAASTRSVRQRVQRLGRVIRRSPGKDVAKVCTIYATDLEEEQLRREAAQFSEISAIEWFDMGIKNG